MNVLQKRALTLLAAIAIAGTGCKGDTGPAGTPGQNGTSNTTTSTLGTSGLVVAVKSVTVNADQTVTVEFTAKDDQGAPVDLAGKYSLNAPMTPRFSLSQVNVAADGRFLPYSVLTKTGTSAYTTTAPDPSTVTVNPTAVAPATPAVPATTGVLTENGTGAGDYSYTFPTGGTASAPGTGNNAGKTVLTVSNAVKVDPKSNNTYVLWIEAARQTNLANTDDAKGFKAVNVEYDFVPGNPSATPLHRQIVATADCTKCHNGFKPDGSVSSAFHGGTRVEAAYCDVCHNPDRKSTATASDGTTPAAYSGIFVHRIHASKELLLKITTGTQTTGFQGSTTCSTKAPCTCTVAAPCLPNSFHGISDVTYPQDLRNCDPCHGDAHHGGQNDTTANRAVCGSCHDYVVFDPAKVTGLPACVDQSGNQAVDANGNWLQCAHAAGANTDDNSCKGCHVEGGAGYIGDFHIAVAPPDPTNSLVPGGTNTHTNQMYVAAAGALPPGAIQLKYVVSNVTAVLDTSVTPNVLHPQITFKFQQSTDGETFSDVVFNAFGSGKTELIDNFVGSPSAYFAFSVPQDGIAAPADFNASTSAYIKNVWNGTVTGATMTGPDSSGLYTITLSGSVIPLNAKMLTGGIGYTYGTTSNQPMTQTNLPAYPYNWDPVSKTAIAGVGGLLVPVHDEWAVAKGNDGSGTPWVGRRSIVDNSHCLNCHAALGVNPSFHAGQRNDGPTCSFCHNPNQNNSGWSGNAKDFIHALHAGLSGSATLPDGTKLSGGSGIRTVPFGWNAGGPTDGFWEVTFPGQHNYCEACHATPADGTHTYDFSAAASAAAVPNLLASTAATGTVSAASFSSSPYITVGTNYGSGFSVSKTTGAATDAAATTLVISPITAACVACHDSPAAKGHMVGNGGLFYQPRSVLAQQVATSVGESCLLCHGPGALVPIADVHQ